MAGVNVASRATLIAARGFRLPNTAVRAPDAAWVHTSRLAQLSAEQWDKFLPLCPDFVLGLRSPSDTLRDVQDKMQECLDNGARWGWLIDPIMGRVHVYRPGAPVRMLERPDTISGESVLPRFVLNLREIW